MREDKFNFNKSIINIILILLALIVLFPLYLILLNSIKSYSEAVNSLTALPKAIHLENFKEAWAQMNFGTSFLNSLGITFFSVIGLILFSSMASYQIARHKSKVSSIIFYSILGSMAVPFQVIMVPTVIVAKNLHLIDKTYGLVIMYWGFLLPFAVFLYHGFINSVPKELEEAAMIDGCGQIRTFFLIVFPMLKPITATLVIINGIAVFNDFMLPLIMLSSNNTKTIPLATSIFFSSYSNAWNLIMAALALTIVPILAFFLIMQKSIMGGLTQGAIKG